MFSSESLTSCLWPLQLPLEMCPHTELTTLSACVFLQKSAMLGFNLFPLFGADNQKTSLNNLVIFFQSEMMKHPGWRTGI